LKYACKPHPIIRGALAGIIVNFALGINPLLDGEPMGAVILVGAGLIYGVIIDLMATWLSKEKEA